MLFVILTLFSAISAAESNVTSSILIEEQLCASKGPQGCLEHCQTELGQTFNKHLCYRDQDCVCLQPGFRRQIDDIPMSHSSLGSSMSCWKSTENVSRFRDICRKVLPGSGVSWDDNGVCYCDFFTSSDRTLKNWQNASWSGNYAVYDETRCLAGVPQCLKFCNSHFGSNLEDSYCVENRDCLCIHRNYLATRRHIQDTQNGLHYNVFTLGGLIRCSPSKKKRRICRKICEMTTGSESFFCRKNNDCYCYGVPFKVLPSPKPEPIVLLSSNYSNFAYRWKRCIEIMTIQQLETVMCVGKDERCFCIDKKFRMSGKRARNPSNYRDITSFDMGKGVQCTASQRDKEVCRELCQKLVDSVDNPFCGLDGRCACFTDIPTITDASRPLNLISGGCYPREEMCIKRCLRQMGGIGNLGSYICRAGDCYCVNNHFLSEKKERCQPDTNLCTSLYSMGDSIRCGPGVQDRLKCLFLCRSLVGSRTFVCDPDGTNCFCEKSSISNDEHVVTSNVKCTSQRECKDFCDSRMGTNLLTSICVSNGDCVCVKKNVVTLTHRQRVIQKNVVEHLPQLKIFSLPPVPPKPAKPQAIIKPKPIPKIQTIIMPKPIPKLIERMKIVAPPKNQKYVGHVSEHKNFCATHHVNPEKECENQCKSDLKSKFGFSFCSPKKNCFCSSNTKCDESHCVKGLRCSVLYSKKACEVAKTEQEVEVCATTCRKAFNTNESMCNEKNICSCTINY